MSCETEQLVSLPIVAGTKEVHVILLSPRNQAIIQKRTYSSKLAAELTVSFAAQFNIFQAKDHHHQAATSWFSLP